MGQLKNLLMDLDVYAFRQGLPRWTCPFMPLIFPTTWAVVHYRVSRCVLLHLKIPVLRQLVRGLLFFIGKLVNILTGMEISVRADIGGGLYIPHLGTIVIGHQTVIGKYAFIHQEVTFGNAGRNPEEMAFPRVGDCVYFGAGAKILGGINIGSDVMIGCNAVVIKDIPDHATAVGIPARVVNDRGSCGNIRYRNQAAVFSGGR